MSRLIDQVGLTDGVGLTDRAGLYKFGTFDPLRLNPYLLFDAATSMIGTLENPTLDLDPANPETLDVITATRASVATRTLPDGSIALAEQDTVRVDYTQGAELTPTKFQLVPHTDFSTAHWAYLNGTVVTTDTTLNPDGATAKKFSAANGVSSSSVRSIISTPTTSNTYTLSWYAKSAGFDESMVRIDAGGATIQGSVNLLTGAVTLQTGSALDSISSEAVSGGWFRISMTFSLSGAGGSIMTRFYPTYSNGYYGDGSSGVYLAQPQLEESTTASSFVENTTGSPKFITGATFGPRVPMILVEPSATNLIPYSEDFSQSAWSKNNVTLSSGFSAPDGSMNASKLEANATDSSLQNTFTVASGTTYSVSFYLKTISGSLETAIGLGSPGFPQNEGEGGRYKNITVTDEWQRFTLTSTADANAATGISFGGFSSFSTGEEVYIWGAQLETGIATSYIPTSGSTAQRAKDDLVISGSAFTDFYNQSEGTFYVESITNRADGQPFILSADNSADSSENNTIVVYYSDTTTTTGFIKTSGSIQAILAIGSRPSAGALSRTSLSYKTNDIEGSVDGGSVASDTSATIPTTINRLSIGTRLTLEDDYKITGHVKRLIFWPYHSDSL